MPSTSKKQKLSEIKGFCKSCDKPLVFKSIRDLGRKKYCSHSCKGKNSLLSKTKSACIKRFACKCKRCDIDFISISKRNVYCGKKCQWSDSTERFYALHNDLKSFFNRLKNKPEIDRNLSLKFLLSLYDKQNGLCALSKRPMTWISRKGKILTNVSIDRIDNSKGYEENNIQLVCLVVNIMKHTCSNQELVSWCKDISENSHS